MVPGVIKVERLGLVEDREYEPEDGPERPPLVEKLDDE
jgi:hypothetical protein